MSAGEQLIPTVHPLGQIEVGSSSATRIQEAQLKLRILKYSCSLNADVAGCAEREPTSTSICSSRPALMTVRKMIDHREVPVADAVQHDYVADQIGVRLLPERFLAFAPDRRDDGGDVECLGVGIERVVQRVVANVAIERDFDIVLFASTPFQDALKLAA
jgi:hypothetical protein